jgi:hypothetical protein
MAKRRRDQTADTGSHLPLIAASRFEPLLRHLAWLAEAETAHSRSPGIPIGWGFRVYNAAVLLRLRWIQAGTLQAALSESSRNKLARGIDKLVNIASDAIEELRTAKGQAKTAKLKLSAAERKKLSNLLEKVLRLALKHLMLVDVPAERTPEYEKRLPIEDWLASTATTSSGTATTGNETLDEYCRALGAVIATHGPKSRVLSAENKKLAQQMSVACLRIAAERVGRAHTRERRAVRNLTRSLRASRP